MRVATIVLTGMLISGCQDVGPGSSGATQAEQANESAETPFFVGRWAANEKMCKDAAWELTRARLSTPGHTVCSFDRVRSEGGLYNVEATCTAEGPPGKYELRISYAQSAKALLGEGGPMEPIGLVACG